MTPEATFKKRDYSFVCNSPSIVRISLDSGDLDGTIYLKIASNSCSFNDGSKLIQKSYTSDLTEVKFSFSIKCTAPQDYYTRLFVWAENQDGESDRDMATISIDCD